MCPRGGTEKAVQLAYQLQRAEGTHEAGIGNIAGYTGQRAGLEAKRASWEEPGIQLWYQRRPRVTQAPNSTCWNLLYED